MMLEKNKKKVKVIQRLKEEFYCNECSSYFDTYLRTNMTGNYTIQCPNDACKHHHYRYVKAGLVTSDRCNEKAGQLDILVALKSSLRKVPWHKDPDYNRSRFKRIEGGKNA
jgi:hypothetical protein